MLKKTLLFLGLIFSTIVVSQTIQVQDTDSYETYVELLSKSKDLKYEEILAKYDAYLANHPDDIQVHIYRCRFIGNAYYDAYEDYDLNYEISDACREELYSNYPNEPEVMLLKLEFLYGEENTTYFEEVIAEYNRDPSVWKADDATELFKNGAYLFSEEDDEKAIEFAEKAIAKNDSLDLSLLISNAYLRIGNKEKAKENIINNIERDSEAWELSQKGELLVKLKENELALEVFDRVQEKDSSYTNTEGLYQIFLNNGDPEQARSYLLKDTLGEWNKSNTLQKLLKHDMEHSEAETSLEIYRRMQQESYYDDFFGIKRIKLFFQSPFEGWTFNELSHLPLLLLLFACLLLVPYLWVLPIYALGNLFRKKRFKIKIDLPKLWGLKHFWLISFAYLVAQSLLVLFFYYEDYMNSIFDITYSYLDELSEESEILTATTIIFFTVSTFVFTLLFLNKKRLQFVFNSRISILRMLLLSWGFVILNGIILRVLGSFIDLTEVSYYITSLDIKEDISVLISQRGFLLSAVLIAGLVPFYEEIIFRGIILSSTEKHIGFVKANVFQAALFATVHFNLSLFIFYFIFGIITGYTVKKTNGLLTGIIFHAVNNFLVIWALYSAFDIVAG